MHLYIIALRRGFPKWISEPVTRKTDNIMHKRKPENNLQSTIQETQDRETRTPLKTGDDIRCTGRVSSSCSTSTTRHVTLGTHPVLVHDWGKDPEVQRHACKMLLNLHKNKLMFWSYFLLGFKSAVRIQPLSIPPCSTQDDE